VERRNAQLEVKLSITAFVFVSFFVVFTLQDWTSSVFWANAIPAIAFSLVFHLCIIYTWISTIKWMMKSLKNLNRF
jgi:hypothetical protein